MNKASKNTSCTSLKNYTQAISYSHFRRLLGYFALQPFHLLKIASLTLFVVICLSIISPAHAYSDPNPTDHTYDYGNGADLVPSSCRSGNHLLWENKRPDTVFDNDAQHDKLVHRKSMVIFDTGDLPNPLKSPPAGGTLFNIKSLGAWETDGDWRPHEQMLVIVIGQSDNIIWISNPTDDLDGVLPKSVVSAGSILITEKVKKIIISHVDNIDYGIGDNIYHGSVIPDHVCIEYSTTQTSPDQCYAITDNVAELYKFDLDHTTPPTVVNMNRIFNGEGTAYRATDNALYVFDQTIKSANNPSDLYKVEMDGTSTLIVPSFIPNRATGAEFVQYSDGSEHFIVLMNQFDSKIEIHDVANLASKTPLSSLTLKKPDGSNAGVFGLAINPTTGEVIVIEKSMTSSTYTKIYSVNMNTGQLTLKTTLAVPGIDAESLAFAQDGFLYTENEGFGNPSYHHQIFRINLATGSVTPVEKNLDLVVSGDIEALSCTGSKIITPPPLSQCTSPLSFENPVLESGVKKQKGAIYRFPDVKTNATGPDVDALVEILDISNAVILDIDSTISGTDSALQVELDLDNSSNNTSAVPDKHVDFEIRFVESGTNNPITIGSTQATAIDVDGKHADWAGGLTVRTREYVKLPDAEKYTLEKATNLTSPSPGHFIPKDYRNWNGINTTNTLAMVTADYKNVSSIKYTAGIQSEGTSYSSYHRQFSLNFGCFPYDEPVEPVVASCPNGSVGKLQQLAYNAASPWPGNPAISYTITPSNFTGGEYVGGVRSTPDGRYTTVTGPTVMRKENGTNPTKLNIKFSQPIPASELAYISLDFDDDITNDNVGTLRVISGTATPADFSHDGPAQAMYETSGLYDPATGKVSMSGLSTNTNDGGYLLLGNSTATVQELEVTTGTYLANTDWIYASFYNIDCSVRPDISGNVFQDDNTNDIFDAGELSLANIKVSLYNDLNNDGNIDGGDTLVASINSADDGSYKFTSVDDGNFLVQVDDTDVDLPANLSLGGANPLDITINGTSATDVNFPFDPSLCTALTGEVSEAALLSPASVSKGDFVIVPSTSVIPNEVQGHLRAYELDKKGIPKAKAKWDADDKMTKKIRKNSRLYSTVGQGKKGIATFANLDTTLFGVSSDQASIIKGYTIDPSKDSGKYLAGRKSGSYLGSISRNNGIALLNDAIDTFQYLDDTDYQSYYSKYVKSRDERVLLGSDDGFIYSFDYDDGELAWGWMPSSLVKELKDYTTFQSNQFMRGQIDTFDLKSKKGNYNPYVVGTYKGGLGHYVLKLDKKSSSKSNLKSVVWESDVSDSFVSSPNMGQMEYFTDDNELTYAAFVMTNSSNKSTLFIRSLTDSKKLLEIPLDFNVTSTPFIMFDFKKHTAPVRKTLYLGDDNGNIYSAPLLNSKGKLKSLKSIKNSLEGKKIAALASIDTDPVLFVGASVSLSNNQYYLRAQSKSRLSVFKYDSQKKGWNRQWTTAIQSSEKINSDGSVTANPAGIQVLPIAKITDNSYIVSDSIVLPVNEVDLTTSSCSGKGYYYLYKLTDGSAPQKTFLSADDTYITGKVYLGYGNPTRIVLGDLPQKDTLAGYGHTDQKDDNTTGISQTVFIKDSFPTGIRSWRVIDDQGY